MCFLNERKFFMNKKKFLIFSLLFISIFSFLSAEWKSIDLIEFDLNAPVEIDENIVYVQHENWVYKYSEIEPVPELIEIPIGFSLIKVDNSIIYYVNSKKNSFFILYSDKSWRLLSIKKPFKDIKIDGSNIYILGDDKKIYKLDILEKESKFVCLGEKTFEKIIKAEGTSVYVLEGGDYFKIDTWRGRIQINKVDPRIACGIIESDYCFYQHINNEIEVCGLRGSLISRSKTLGVSNCLRDGFFNVGKVIYVQYNDGIIYARDLTNFNFNNDIPNWISLGSEKFQRLLGAYGPFVYAQGLDGLIYKWV